MKVGISFVSVANVRANLTAENPGWSVDTVARAATAEWNATLGRIARERRHRGRAADLLLGALPRVVAPERVQ